MYTDDTILINFDYILKQDNLINNKKLVVAKCLENINRCLNEAFESSVGTQRSDLGAYKKFALNLVTVALPY